MEDFPKTWDAVFWDIGGVIVDHGSLENVHQSFIKSLIDHQSLDVTVESALDTWRQAVGAHFRERDGTEFRRAEDAYHLGVKSVVGGSLDRSVWRPLFDQAFTEYIEPVPNALSTLDALAERDEHLGIISDIDDREAERILAQFGIESAFDSVTTSEEVGRTKPDASMFTTALGKASLVPERTLMIGDRYRHDIEGATNAGMTAIAFGADSGPAVDFHVDDLSEIIDILDGDYDSVLGN